MIIGGVLLSDIVDPFKNGQRGKAGAVVVDPIWGGMPVIRLVGTDRETRTGRVHQIRLVVCRAEC